MGCGQFPIQSVEGHLSGVSGSDAIHMAGEKGLDPQIGNPREGAQCTSASENAAGTTQEPAGSGRGLCQALRPVTVQLAGEKGGSVSISRNPEPSKEKGEGHQG